MDRFDRNIRFFGAEGQRRLQEVPVAVVGCGGLGQHVIQQIACLGVKTIYAVDDEDLDITNLNRYVLARYDDPIPGTHKTDMALRAVAALNPELKLNPIRASLRSRDVFEALHRVSHIFGCFDNDGARLVLNDFSLAYGKTLIDMSSDIESDAGLRYGGRIAYVKGQAGCLVCMDLLDLAQAARDLASDASRRDRNRIYGVDANDLDEAGPSVVSINGVIASLGVTEFAVDVSGIRSPKQLVTYRGHQGIVTVRSPSSHADCYHCTHVKNAGPEAGVERYIEKEERREIGTCDDGS
jgi:hypothetical protein